MRTRPVLRWATNNVAEKIKKGRSIVKAMSGNANFQAPNPGPNPSLPEVAKAIDNLELAATDVDENGGGGKWYTIQSDREKELDELMSKLADYVNFVAKGSVAIIESAAMEATKTPEPATKLPKPGDVSVEPGGEEGSVLIKFNAVKGNSGYKVFMSDFDTPLQWEAFKNNTCTDNKLYITGLESGKRKWFRVIAFNTAGDGDYSDPAMVMVP